MKNLLCFAALSLLCNISFGMPHPAETDGSEPSPKSEIVGISYGSFNLINSITDQVITTISDGDTFFLDIVGDSLNIQVVPSQSVGSVRFTTDDGYNLVEGVGPYAYQGDISGDYNDWTPSEGILIFTVKYYSGGSATGTLLATDTFSITFAATAPPPSGGEYWSQSVSSIYYNGGNVGIGTTAPGSYKLAVNGKIHAKEVKVDLDGWADYVFTEDYNLPTLQEVKKHIIDNGHLINIPSAQDVEANGILLGEMNKLLLEKIEELTLYLLQEEAERKDQEIKIYQMEKRIFDLENSH